MMATRMASSINDCEEFFASTQVPSDLKDVIGKVQSFVEYHRKSGRWIVLLTSGGTLIPLEKRTVRHVDNFSTGTRGSLSAEEFLSLEYAVIFLHRQSSLFPYARLLQSEAILDSFSCNSNGTLSVDSPLKEPLLDALRKYKEARSHNLLLSVPFTDVFQYLHYLCHISQLLKSAGKTALVYLAAAVSDFYVHPRDMAEHKIQSSSTLNIKLQEVPKMLRVLVQDWAPDAFVVSFKLETDEEKLIPKSRAALEKYKHNIVVANVLDKRKDELFLVSSDRVEGILLSPQEKAEGIPIENKLVLFLKMAHSRHVQS